MRQRLRGMEGVTARRGASREGVPGQAAETRRMVGGRETGVSRTAFPNGGSGTSGRSVQVHPPGRLVVRRFEVDDDGLVLVQRQGQFRQRLTGPEEATPEFDS